MAEFKTFTRERLGKVIFLAGVICFLLMLSYLVFLDLVRPSDADTLNEFSFKFKAVTKIVFVSEMDKLIINALGVFSICIVGLAVWLLQKGK
jgi:hypothetical protein